MPDSLKMRTPLEIWHPWWKWECHRNGFYSQSPLDGLSEEESADRFLSFFLDSSLFEHTAQRVLEEWRHSSEHFLTKQHINRVAWLGQAAACLSHRVPSRFKPLYYDLPTAVQKRQNNVAECVISGFYARLRDRIASESICEHMAGQRLFRWDT